jgi:hypothetical protein
LLEENVTIEGIIGELILYYNSRFVPFRKEEWEFLMSKNLTSKLETGSG